MKSDNITASSVKPCCSREALFFWLAAVSLLFLTLGYRSLWGSEGRWAEVAREMILTGDWFHPAINGVPYFDKPLFSYWVIIFASWITGALNEFSIRAPGAVAGLVAIWATVKLGQQLFSEKAGYVAGWLLLTSYGMLFWSRTACADIENVAFIMLAVLWYWKRRERPGFISYLVFYMICFTGANFKGLPAAVLPVLICLPDILRTRPWHRHLSISHGVALLAGMLFYILPFMYAAFTSDGYGQNGLHLVFRENILRFFHAFDHKEPFYVYLYYVPMLFLPWLPLLFSATVTLFKRYSISDYRYRWLVEATVVIFFVYTLSDSRRSYYILPILPFCALVTAVFITGSMEKRWKGFALSSQFYLIAALSVVELFAPLIARVVTAFTGIVPPDGLSTSFTVTGAVTLVFLYAVWKKNGPDIEGEKKEFSLNGVLAATLLLSAGFYLWQQNVLEEYRYNKSFILEVKREIGSIPPKNIALGKDMASLVFYLGYDRPVKIMEKKEDIVAFLLRKDTRYLILQRRMLSKRFSSLPDNMKRTPWMSMPLYPGQKKKKKQLLVWRLTGPVEIQGY